MSISYTGSTTPSGSAGGDLGGTYPNPTVTALTHAALTWTDYTPTWTGFSANPVLNFARYAQIGKLVLVSISISSAGTSNTTGLTVTMPTNVKNQFTVFTGAATSDNSANKAGAGFGLNLTANSAVVTCYLDGTFNATGWTNSGTKSWDGFFCYEAQ